MFCGSLKVLEIIVENIIYKMRTLGQDSDVVSVLVSERLEAGGDKWRNWFGLEQGSAWKAVAEVGRMLRWGTNLKDEWSKVLFLLRWALLIFSLAVALTNLEDTENAKRAYAEAARLDKWAFCPMGKGQRVFCKVCHKTNAGVSLVTMRHKLRRLWFLSK